MPDMKRIAVIGAGSWGTAIAHLLGSDGNQVRLWARKASVCDGINTQHRNPRYLSDCPISANVTASDDYAWVTDGAEAVVVVTPSAITRDVAKTLAPLVSPATPIVICSKGIEAETGLTPVEVFDEELGGMQRLAALTGPNHAEEVIKLVPSGTVVSSADAHTAEFFQRLFATDTFRTYVSDDVKGAEICAAYKNVIAIAVGVSYGLGMGDNTAALLMTRGLAEMSRLVTANGGKAMTCMGLAGMGDLVVTCTSTHSRNRTFGVELAHGTTLEAYREKTHMVVEGALACKTLDTLARRGGVELPIAQVVRDVIWNGLDLQQAKTALLERSLKPEFY
jgi:glycerol-3-phosphate dehydrogenase (NAD(P)+)